jgi:hypothetical protein
MNARRHLVSPFLIALLLGLGSAGYANAACSPSTYAYCWGQYEACIINGGEEESCTTEYFDCLTRRGCG